MNISWLATVIIFSSLTWVYGQSPGSSPKAKYRCGKLISSFDKSTNETQVQLRRLILEGIFQIAPGESLRGENFLPNDDHGVAFTVIYSYAGKVPSKPESLILVVEAENTQPKYESNRELSLDLDGSNSKLPSTNRTVRRTNLGLTREELSTQISFEQFMKIISTKKVKIILGNSSFALNECHMDALRRLGSALPK